VWNIPSRPSSVMPDVDPSSAQLWKVCRVEHWRAQL
jgi:hypothetical protein